MIFKNARGLEVTASSQLTVDSLDQFSDALLGFSDQSGTYLDAAAADDTCPLAQSLICLDWLSAETSPGNIKAKIHLGKAIEIQASATPREKKIIKASQFWTDGDLREAALTFDELLTVHPDDITSAKICQGLYFNLGDAPGILRAPMKVAERCSDSPYTHGMLAFGYEECNLLDEAEASALKAIDMQRKEPWAHHAYAHVCEARGNYEQGAAFMEELSDSWTGLSSFMYTHNWWHMCLSYIDMNRLDDALVIFDQHIWCVDKGCVQDQINAISLLYRLERVGVDPGDRWSDIAKFVAERAYDQVSVFLDLQFIYALARADHPESDKMLERIHKRAEQATPHERNAWQKVAGVAAPGLVDLARGKPDTASGAMISIFPYLSQIGGSFAQRDLMHLFHLDSLIATGEFHRAHEILEKRRMNRPSVNWIRRSLNTVYNALDLPKVAKGYVSATDNFP
jgi:hypothetical protein